MYMDKIKCGKMELAHTYLYTTSRGYVEVGRNVWYIYTYEGRKEICFLYRNERNNLYGRVAYVDTHTWTHTHRLSIEMCGGANIHQLPGRPLHLAMTLMTHALFSTVSFLLPSLSEWVFKRSTCDRHSRRLFLKKKKIFTFIPVTTSHKIGWSEPV